MNSRAVLRLTGADRVKFLDGIVTNRVPDAEGELVYAALLSPQGKYLADFFLLADGSSHLIDVDASLCDALRARFMLYVLRADVSIAVAPLFVHRGMGPAPADALTDPRHPELGWRAYRDVPQSDDGADWDAIRARLLVPQSGTELIANESYILEANFEALNGVDFRKGCYVGQEVTARMKHKTTLRKGLAALRVTGECAPGDTVWSDGRDVGRITTRAGDHAIAYLRFDRATGALTAGEGSLTITGRI